MENVYDKVLSFLEGRSPQAALTRNALIGIGLLWSTKQAFDFLNILNLYFLRSSSLKKYIASSDGRPNTWALVTGASDGIGKGFAEELCSLGVNVVIHGRNETKLQGVKENLLKRWPNRQIRLLVLDAAAAATDATKLDEAAKLLQDLNLRILINNVGGNGSVKPIWAELKDRSCSDIGEWMDVNARFPTEITRVLLPQLIRNKASLVINIGSAANIMPCPYLSQYSGAKAYIRAWSKSMGAEMKAEKHDVEFLYIEVGTVSTETSGRPPGFFGPTPKQFAKGALARVGCGEYAWGYWPHLLQIGFLNSMPKSIGDKILLSIAMQQKKHYDEMEKPKSQ